MAAVMLAAVPALAAEKGFYIAGNGGLTMPTDVDEGNTVSTYDPGFNGAGAVGYDLGDFRIEAEYAYHRVGTDEVFLGATRIDVPGSLEVISYMVNGHYDFEVPNSPLMPSVGLGIGGVESQLEIRSGPLAGKQRDSEFGFQLMLGMGVEMSKHLAFTVGYKFLSTAELDDEAMLHDINLGFRYLF